MNVDQILAMSIFILIISWSFVYYYSLFQEGEDIQKYTIEMVGNKILDNISVDTYTIPVTLSSTENLTLHTLYFDYIWKGGTGNSSRVFDVSGTALDCELYGDEIYWRSDITAGEEHYFEVRYAAGNLPLNCTRTTYHNAVNKSKIIPRSEEKTLMISTYLMNAMDSVKYYQFKSQQDIAEDFHVEITSASGTFEYGIPVPSNRNVYSLTFKRTIWESGEEADIMINLW